MDYWDKFPDLAGLVLEKSWVLEVAPSERAMALRLDAVMTEDHPRFRPAERGEQYAYLTGWLTLSSEEPVEVELSGAAPTRDDAGDTDLGQVDRFERIDQESWEAEGDWGRARLHRPVVSFVADGRDPLIGCLFH
mgnify:FL=1